MKNASGDVHNPAKVIKEYVDDASTREPSERREGIQLAEGWNQCSLRWVLKGTNSRKQGKLDHVRCIDG